MKYIKISISNVKKFKSLIFNFSDGAKTQCIAGINGCGKSTVFQSLQLLQQAYIYSNDLNDNSDYLEYEDRLSMLYADIFTAPQSKIRFEYEIDGQQLFIEMTMSSIGTQKDPSFTTNDSNKMLYKMWNIRDPKNLFLYIPPYKIANENPYTFDNAKLKNEHGDNILKALYYPEEIYRNAYVNIIENHICERISPSKPSKNHQLQTAFQIFSKIFPGARFEKISANNPNNEFNIIARIHETDKCDIRKFSAGEKATLLTLYHLISLKKFSVICFDEFENHFHEKLIGNLFNEFCKILDNNTLLEYLKDANLEVATRSDEFYREIEISSIIFLTHSRYLLRLNESVGANYIIHNNEIKKISSSINSELVDVQISGYNQRLLYVEGISDVQILRMIPELNHIEIKELGNCDAVVREYESVLRIKNELVDTKVLFLVDGDRFTHLDSVKAKDLKYFNKSFIFNSNHEIENYLLDKDSIFKWIKENSKAYGIDENSIIKDDIEAIINTKIDSLKNESILKLSLLELENELKKRQNEVLNYRVLKQQQNIEAHLKAELKNKLSSPDIDRIVEDSFAKYSSQWETHKKGLVDGKAALGQIFNALKPQYNLPLDAVKPYIKYVRELRSSPLSKLVNEILRLSEL